MTPSTEEDVVNSMNMRTVAQPRGHDPRGFTLVEIMIASFLGLVVLSGVLNLITSQKRAYEAHAQVFEMEQYVRVGMEQMIREIRMAGFGRPTWPVRNVANTAYDITYTVQVTQGTGTDPDTIDIVACFDSPSGALANAAAAGATTLTLGTGEGAAFNTDTKSDVYIDNGENARVTAVSGDVLTIAPALATEASAGTAVYVVTHHTYALNGGNLTRNENLGVGATGLAENIEDLQATFATPVVTLTLQAMTDREDPHYTHPDEGDGYRRRVQTSTIEVRNLTL